ncbi:MAG: YbhB/YbcL family Raf kinase inhibitor-like protein [Aliivibrio sp.]|nr:YbhB/YbcL family Raf kinase inhibitor-like protein [Aliivibrio sp.]
MKFMQIISIVLLTLVTFSSQAFELKSNDVTEGKSLKVAQVFKGWGCTGKNLSPELSWSNPPKGTKSYAVTMYDPDAPTGSGWWHWVVINIPANQTNLAENSGEKGGRLLPKGASMISNSFGYRGFGGACPPPNSKPHNYEITVYALDTDKLVDVPADATAAWAGFFILEHAIGKAVLTAPTNIR